MYDEATPFGPLDVIAFVLTILALGWTVWEAIRARRAAKLAETAADKARRAVERAEGRLAGDGLMVSLGNTKAAVGLIQQAADSLSAELMHHALVQFGDHAFELAKRLDKHERDWTDLPEILERNGNDALDVKAKMLKDPTLDIAKSTIAVRGKLDRVAMRITQVQTDLATPTPGGHGA